MKPRIIFVPQYPTPMRYQEWWFWKFPEEFKKAGFEVLTLGKSYYDMICKIVENINEDEPNIVKGNFAPLETAISFECKQINQYMNLELRDTDILFLADLSFPGFFANVLYHKRPSRAYAFCHATSINNYDYFEKCKHSKFLVERGHAKIFDKVFVGSEYHAGKLMFNDMENIEVVSLPLPPKSVINEVDIPKSIDFISVSRSTMQKVNLHIEDHVADEYGIPIYRPVCETWEEYCTVLSESKILLITSREETFGYQVADAILNNCIPIAWNDYSYPELLPQEYLYETMDELRGILDKALDGELKVPELLCKPRMKKFFYNIIKTMRKDGEDYSF
jgi:hypothetical protein